MGRVLRRCSGAKSKALSAAIPLQQPTAAQSAVLNEYRAAALCLRLGAANIAGRRGRAGFCVPSGRQAEWKNSLQPPPARHSSSALATSNEQRAKRQKRRWRPPALPLLWLEKRPTNKVQLAPPCFSNQQQQTRQRQPRQQTTGQLRQPDDRCVNNTPDQHPPSR